jgi:hypothetical protein
VSLIQRIVQYLTSALPFTTNGGSFTCRNERVRNRFTAIERENAYSSFGLRKRIVEVEDDLVDEVAYFVARTIALTASNVELPVVCHAKHVFFGFQRSDMTNLQGKQQFIARHRSLGYIVFSIKQIIVLSADCSGPQASIYFVFDPMFIFKILILNSFSFSFSIIALSLSFSREGKSTTRSFEFVIFLRAQSLFSSVKQIKN